MVKYFKAIVEALMVLMRGLWPGFPHWGGLAINPAPGGVWVKGFHNCSAIMVCAIRKSDKVMKGGEIAQGENIF